MTNQKVIRIQIAIVAIGAIGMTSCSSMHSLLAVSDQENSKPISNPFYNYRPGPNGEQGSPMILRTKKGDRSVEIEIPGDSQNLSDFVLPVSPAFKETRGGRSLASSDGGSEETPAGNMDEGYKSRTASPSDHEITRGFSHGSLEDEGRRRDIEQSLNLTPSEDESPPEGTPSYLAAMDHIKQLYKATRYEAALLETDDMVKQFQTDPRLYEMRGTLLERLGQRELALKSWTQALKLEPKNEKLRRFIDRKQLRSTAGLP